MKRKLTLKELLEAEYNRRYNMGQRVATTYKRCGQCGQITDHYYFKDEPGKIRITCAECGHNEIKEK